MKKFVALTLSALMTLSLCAVGLGTTAASSKADPSESYVKKTAEYEDEDISLWFEYASEKVLQSSTQPTGMDTFSVYMAKNEIEDAQFVLSSSKAKSGLNAAISGFTDANGNTLDAELYIEQYHDCGDSGMVPDAIPPISAAGSFTLTPGQSQSFLIRITSKAETAAGWYTSRIDITDADGKTVKTADVFAYVWDFALSDETKCATSLNLDYSLLTRIAAVDGTSDANLYKNYYDYLLENRVCAYYLPAQLYTPAAQAYMDNPRVTSFQYSNHNGSDPTATALKRIFTVTFAGEEGQKRFEKAYYFTNVVDASKPADLEKLKSKYDEFYAKVSQYKPEYSDIPFRFITTYINDIDYTKSDGTVIDQIDYYGDFVNLWCAKTFAYTEPEELSTPGAKVMQPLKWNSVYGTFKERMAEKAANGQKVWWFISWDVEKPYINYYMQTDGVAQRLLFWQQYANGVQGFLYNFANFWSGDCSDPYTNNVTNSAYPDAHGESILIYPGSKYGMNTPVGSLRLEAMRDGIEDYQMFYMLDEALGSGSADSYIKAMTTGVTSYSVSDGDYYSYRRALGNALEKVLATPCEEHTWEESARTDATCTEDGSITYTCSVCSSVKEESIPKLGHNFVSGYCTRCHEADPDYSPTVRGDVNGDGRVTVSDINYLCRILAGVLTPNSAERASADVNEDGRITVSDINMLKRILAGVA